MQLLYWNKVWNTSRPALSAGAAAFQTSNFEVWWYQPWHTLFEICSSCVERPFPLSPTNSSWPANFNSVSLPIMQLAYGPVAIDVQHGMLHGAVSRFSWHAEPRETFPRRSMEAHKSFMIKRRSYGPSHKLGFPICLSNVETGSSSGGQYLHYFSRSILVESTVVCINTS